MHDACVETSGVEGRVGGLRTSSPQLYLNPHGRVSVLYSIDFEHRAASAPTKDLLHVLVNS